jgi:hypothetical protein
MELEPAREAMDREVHVACDVNRPFDLVVTRRRWDYSEFGTTDLRPPLNDVASSRMN